MEGNNNIEAQTEALGRIRVVLVRPQVAGNVGAVARAMENFAVGELCLVAPKADPLSREALQRSTRGEHRLREARIVSSLEQGLEGVVFAIGASRRPSPLHEAEALSPCDMARIVRTRAKEGHVALLFGTEDNGLSREDLLACDAVVQIPADPAYPTLNLAHAVVICLYEMFVASLEARDAEAPDRRGGEPADLATMTRLIGKLQHALLTIGYLRPEKPDHLMFPIRAILSRARLTRAEAQILMGLAQQIDEFAKSGK
jgi:TrmH family RNA methyltransferase